MHQRVPHFERPAEPTGRIVGVLRDKLLQCSPDGLPLRHAVTQVEQIPETCPSNGERQT
jgi:hypothetical protein